MNSLVNGAALTWYVPSSHSTNAVMATSLQKDPVGHKIHPACSSQSGMLSVQNTSRWDTREHHTVRHVCRDRGSGCVTWSKTSGMLYWPGGHGEHIPGSSSEIRYPGGHWMFTEIVDTFPRAPYWS